MVEAPCLLHALTRTRRKSKGYSRKIDACDGPIALTRCMANVIVNTPKGITLFPPALVLQTVQTQRDPAM